MKNMSAFFGLCVFADDCWKLIVNDGFIVWEEVPLAYDHGHPRFLHSSCVGWPGELIIHGGLVQPFYQLSFLHQVLLTLCGIENR